MTNTAFSTIANRIEALVPQVPRPTTLEHLRVTARLVCEKTLAWRYTPPKTVLTPGVHEYNFDVPTGVEVEAVFGASLNGKPLELINLDVAIARYPEWADLFSGESASTFWSETDSNTLGSEQYNEDVINNNSSVSIPDSITADGSRPVAMTMVSPQKFVVLPLPDDEEVYELRMWLALKPMRSTTEMDTEAFGELEDLFVWGTLETIMAMPNKVWTNPEYSVHYGNKFREGYLEKRRRANLGHVRGSMSVRSVNWL